MTKLPDEIHEVKLQMLSERGFQILVAEGYVRVVKRF